MPPYAERPQTIYKTPGADIGDLRLPAVYMDHCNDCRRATSSILPMGFVAVTDTVRASVLSSPAEGDYAFTISDNDREWLPASLVFDSHNPKLQELNLALYKSSPGRSRWFCQRCGTMVAYSVDEGVIPKEWGWPKMLDIWLGTVDREDLQEDYMKPERMLWCEKGVPWIRELAKNGAGGIPEHPLTKIDKVVGDGIEDDLKELAKLGK